MNLDEYINDDLVIVCPSTVKKKILNKYCDKLYNFTFMSKEEFKNHYYFKYSNLTINYLLEKYNYNLDVCKTYLDSLYVIDINKNYTNSKLQFLKSLKQELIENNLLEFDKFFLDYLKTKKLIVINYNFLEKYELEMFKGAIIISNDIKYPPTQVIKCHTLEEEVLFVIEKISELLNNNISLNKIYIANISSEYLYTIRRLFSYFKIPINLDMQESIYTTKIVQDYLTSFKLPAFKSEISNQLINIINNLIEVQDSNYYQEFLIDKLKKTYLKNTWLMNAVNTFNLEEDILDDDCYLFVLGFNQDILPKTYKDESFITDNMKDEVNIYSVKEKNELSKTTLIKTLSSNKNIFLSYKEKSDFNSYLPSSLIKELGLEVITYDSHKIYNSNLYNKLKLGEYLDNYYKYGETSKLLISLNQHYQINYNSYDNSFTPLNLTNYYKFLTYPFKLSYTSLNTYNWCGFKYYINYLLKLNINTDTFSIFIGNLFHHLFSIMYQEDFNFNEEWDKYLAKYDLSMKEKFFLDKLKDTLDEDIKIIKELEKIQQYRNVLTEQEINIKINDRTYFTGKIDKILYNKQIDDTYFALVDYKTGNINTSINNMKYGVSMQLPIYLYLLSNSNLFTSPIFTGMYFQRVLFNTLKWESNKSLEQLKTANLRLLGYSTDDKNRLDCFDSSYENSCYIKSLKLNKDGSFSKNSKILSDEDTYNILKYTDSVINKTSEKILAGDFSINPKVIDKETACNHCNFKDVCFVRQENYIYLDKVTDLDFLGGDYNG